MTQTLKEAITELQFKIKLLEKQIADLEKVSTKSDTYCYELHSKIEKIKDELNSVKRINLDDIKNVINLIEKEIEKIQGEIDILRLEMPEMRLIKKIVLGLVAFILTAFLGLLWNTTINPPVKKSNDNVEEIIKKITKEYSKVP
jgi:prefoldin subunit 5